MLPRELYLLTVSMLGLIRYRGLQLNPLLQAEDFLHDHPSDCLCARRLFIEEYALVFEDPHVCRACWRFLRELCPATEVEAAERVVAQAALIVRGTAITRATPGGITS
ncbi:MAG: hypothetical protein HYZ00_09980 [Candidatus Hydrogenedentes bacterium]|nr:hypothetical protein [Candidatus Hydrogenedentota bacterium]